MLRMTLDVRVQLPSLTTNIFLKLFLKLFKVKEIKYLSFCKHLL